MITIICKLTLRDGAEVSGRVEARCPGLPYRINYSGAVEHIDLRPETGTPSDLELIFRLTAEKTRATLEVQRMGDYESRTDSFRRTVRPAASSSSLFGS